MRPPFHPTFQAPVLFNRAYVKRASPGQPLCLALERESGLISRFDTRILEADPETAVYVERIVKFLLWSRGGWKLTVGGSESIAHLLRKQYSAFGPRAFDADLMRRVYGRDFEVVYCTADAIPDAKESRIALGGHLDGCRIGFDLGASDYKIAAVQDGEVVFSEEYPWKPREQSNPDYHWNHLNEGLRIAAARLPRVDAIGGSSAGVIVDNEIKVASLFRSVPPEKFATEVSGLFKRLAREWHVPVEVVNDGEVTALSGAMSLGKNAILGIAMGSSEATGYIDRGGRITGWLNELAFAPVDYSPDAGVDEWSGDSGGGALYFSQQAVNRLLPHAGIELPVTMGLPERLKEVQCMMAQDDSRAERIFQAIGACLGYTIAHYADFYDFDDILLLGRVTSGKGGNLVVSCARDVLGAQFPLLADRILLNVPDEQSRRVGQAVAAASLPKLNP
jgi:predicted NBD/HSP70 family sugar kinase